MGFVMRCVQTGRVGLTPDVSGFVINEDLRLPERLRRTMGSARAGVRARLGAAVGSVQMRAQQAVRSVLAAAQRLSGAAGSLIFSAAFRKRRAISGQEPAEVPDQPRAARNERLDRLVRRLRITAAAGLIRGQQMLKISGERWRLADRLRDLRALLAVVLRWSLRRLWRAPRTLQAGALAGIGLWLAPWPEAPAAAPPTLAMAMAVAPVEAPREPDLWKQVPGVIAAWHLEAPEIDRSVMKYRARRQANGARQDMLTWFEEPGDDGARPRNRVSGALAVEHYPAEPPRTESLFMDAARRTALVGAGIEKMSDAYRIHNKFGAFEIADAVLSGPSGDRKCLVFRHVAAAVPLQLHGWFCAAPERSMGRATLNCLLDRIDLIGGASAPVRAWFAKAERSRKACGAYPVAVAPAGWVDADGRMPDLKAAISSSRKM